MIPYPPKPKRCFTQRGGYLVPTQWFINWQQKCREIDLLNQLEMFRAARKGGRIQWGVTIRGNQ